MNEISDDMKKVLYSETSASLRHYSGILLQVRTTVVVQGLVVLAGAGYLILQSLYVEAAVMALFSGLMAAVLLGLHSNYYIHFQRFLDKVVEVETGIFGTPHTGPWSHYDASRKRMTNCFIKKTQYHLGLFALVITVSVGLAIYATFQCCF
ncbi:MAG: hypothetical protein Q8M16_11700 [Pirellulaceae bacterium]|nr:hypothetical protein [Pirellulaceae bacterium]